MKVLRSYLVFVISSLLVLMSCNVSAETKKSLEYKVKAAYLYNFAKFVVWPVGVLNESSNITINYCIYGKDPFGHAISLIKNKVVQGHKVRINYLNPGDGVEFCHVLYFANTSPEAFRLLAQHQNSPILTVSDAENFASNGGCIGLNISGGKVRFNINAKAIEEAGLKVSAKLMELAEVVIR